MKKAHTIPLLFIIFVMSASVFGQEAENTKNNKDSTKRSDAKINPTSLGMELSIPLGSAPGRAGTSLPITFNYSSKVWHADTVNVPEDGHAVYWSSPVYADNSMSGWTTSLQPLTYEDSRLIKMPANAPPNPPIGMIYQIIPKITLHLMDGSTVELAAALTPQSVQYGMEPTYSTYTSFDGSNLKLVIGSGLSTLYMPNGGKYEWSSTNPFTYIDRNGNVMIYQINSTTGLPEWTDTMGRAIVTPPGIPHDTNNQPIAGNVDYYVPTLPGHTTKWTFKWKKLEDSFGNLNGTYSVKHLDQLFGTLVVQTMSLWNHNPVVLNELVQPDGRNYKFYYNEWGEIEKIVYPTGAVEKFTHSQYGPFSFGGRGQGLSKVGNRGVATRVVSVDSNPANDMTWTYNIPTNPTNYAALPPYTVKTTNPDGTRTERLLFGDSNPPSNYLYLPSQLAGKAYEERAFDANNNLVRRELTNWVGSSYGTNAPINAYTRVDKKVSIGIEGTSALAQSQTMAYDGYLNVTRQTAYDFIVPSLSTAQTGTIASFSLGTALKTAETTYITDTNYTSRQMVSMPILTTVKTGDQYGSIVAKSESFYDDMSLVSSGALSGNAAASWVDPNTIYRGNPTTAKVWKNTDNTWIATHAQFDQYGNLRKSIDAKGNAGETEYSTDYACAYATKTKTPPPSDGTNGSNTAFETTATYDYTTGLPLTQTDANGQTSSIEYNDPLLRPTKVIPPTGAGITETIYNDTPGNLWVKNRTQIDDTKWAEGITYIDNLGRAYKSQKIDAQGDVFADTEFDYASRPKRVTNPYRTGEAKQWTTNTYDEQSRVKQVDLPDTTNVKTDFGISTTGVIGITKQVTDQAGKKRKGISDALGRMVRVIEDPTGQNLNTDYVFDTLGNLRKTIQGEQSRYFMHDSIGRLLYAKQPEQDANSAFSGTNYTDPVTSNNQWSVKYSYDDNGNITSTTDARNVSITATYDNLNRLKLRDYSDATPDVDFYYDGKYRDVYDVLQTATGSVNGQTTGVKSTVSKSNNIAFDNLGRLTTSQQITDGQTYGFGYAYNLSGGLIEETYPSTRVVKNVIDNDGDLAIVQSKKNANTGFFNYAKNFNYNSAGAATKMQLGNGHWETASYNERLQVTQIGLGVTNADQNLLKLEFKYNTTGQNDNNGSMREQKITVPTVGSNAGFTATQTYAYDSLNRLQSATETISSAQTWKQTFSYDRFGNRRFDAANTTTLGTCSTAICNPSFDTSKNRFSSGQGYSYDSAGSITQDATNQRFGYDAESHQKEFFTAGNSSNTPDASYSYDGEGKRVKKTVGSEVTIFVYDAGGRLSAEYSSTVASSSDAKVDYLTTDHLGSPRIATDANGSVINRKDFGAFGDETVTSQRTTQLGYTPPNVRQDYTGYEKDSESGLEYAQARYYNPQHGRYTSVDPLTASASIRNPQTLNRYSYALNSPYKFTDPLGLVAIGAGQGASGGMDVNHAYLNDPKGFDVDSARDASYDHLTTQTQAYAAFIERLRAWTVAMNALNPPPPLTPRRVVALAAFDTRDPPAGEAFFNRANQATEEADKFSTGSNIISALKKWSVSGPIDDVIIHDHGFVGGIVGNGEDIGLYTMEYANQLNPVKPGVETSSTLAYAIVNNSIDISKNGTITIFGCNCSNLAQEISAKLGNNGRPDISVTGANNWVYEKNGAAAVDRRSNGISNGSRGTFITYRNGIQVTTNTTRSYK